MMTVISQLPINRTIRILICALTSLILLSACSRKQSVCIEAPTLSSINIIDRNGLTETINNPDRLEQYENVNFLEPQPYQKVLRIYSRDPLGNISACITSYHPNGYPYQYLEVVNSRACGAYTEWYTNGVMKISANVIGGTADLVGGAEKSWIFDGCCQAWNENGDLEANIYYEKGELEGISTYYHPDGSIWKTIPYHKNTIEGIVDIFTLEGRLLQKSNYCNGRKEGAAQRYWQGEILAAEEMYSAGLLVYGRYYNSNGELIASIDDGNGIRAIFGKEGVRELHEYHDGILNGAIEVLDPYGRISKLYHIKNGFKHGEEIIFHEAVRLKQKLLPKLSITWYEGKIQGTSKTWYDNGMQESQRELSNNKKNGHCTAWYRDGSLMMIEEYEQDQLIRGEYFEFGEKSPITTVEEGHGYATIFDSEGNFERKIEYKGGKPVIDERSP